MFTAAARRLAQQRSSLPRFGCRSLKTGTRLYGSQAARAAPGGLALGVSLALGGGTVFCLSVEDWSTRSLEDEAVDVFAASDEYTRVDLTMCQSGKAADNAIFDAMGAKTDGLKAYRIYAKKDGSEVCAVVVFGSNCRGHPGIVHGGVTSLLFDNTLGWANAFDVLQKEGLLRDGADPVTAASENKKTTALFGFTAFLHVNYKKPVLTNSAAILRCKLDRHEGRKRFLEGAMTCAKTGALLADASALYVVPRPALFG